MRLGTFWRAPALVLVISTALFRCNPDVSRLPCNRDDNCPTGYSCDEALFCVERPRHADAGDGTGGGSPSGGGTATGGGSSTGGGGGAGGGFAAGGGVGGGTSGGGAGGGTADDGGNAVDAGPPGFPQPEGTVAVNFTVDDTANQVFLANDGGASDLQWKGTVKYDALTRRITKDPTWSGPFPPLYDDGPWTTGGHEPIGNLAGDHKWGITVFAKPPLTVSDVYEYGAQDATTQGWLWRGDNGRYVVAAGATDPVTADGLTLLPFGTTDLKLVVDTNALASRILPDGGTDPWDLTAPKVKGSKWGWVEAPVYDDGAHGDDTAGDHKYAFVLSDVVGVGRLVPHYGLLSSGDTAEFVCVFAGHEYKLTPGISAYLKPDGGSFVARSISIAANGNPRVDVP